MSQKVLVMGAFVIMASAWADQVVMKNGDRVTGAIVKKDAKTLTIKTTHFGTVTLPWDQVAEAKADTPINIVMPGDQVVKGTLSATPEKVEVTTNGATKTVPPAEIVALRDAAEQTAYERLLKPRIADLWLGNANIGWAGTKGNAQTATLSMNMGAGRVTRTDKTTVYFNAIRASALLNNVNAQTAQAMRGGLAYNRNIKPRIFLNVFNDWETDKFQFLDLRMVLGGGLGANVWKSDRGRFDLLGGMAYNREKFDPAPKPKFTRTGADAYWGDDFNYKVGTRTSLFQSFRMFNNVKEGDRYRINFDVGATTQVTKWLTWNLGLSDRFLNVPAAGRKKNDFLYTTGFGFSFAR